MKCRPLKIAPTPYTICVAGARAGARHMVTQVAGKKVLYKESAALQESLQLFINPVLAAFFDEM